MDALTELDRHRYLSLETFRATGVPARTVVWFAAVDGKLFVVTAGGSGKVKRLRRSSRARIAPCNARGGVQDDWREATARVIAEPALIAAASAALRRKYGWQTRLLDALSRLTGRMRQRAWIEIAASADGGRLRKDTAVYYGWMVVDGGNPSGRGADERINAGANA